jgi:hypothetical protein
LETANPEKASLTAISACYVLDAMLRPIPCRDYLRLGFWLLNPSGR